MDLQVGDAIVEPRNAEDATMMQFGDDGKLYDQAGERKWGVIADASVGAAVVFSDSFGLQFAIRIYRQFVTLEETKQLAWKNSVGLEEVHEFQSIQAVIFTVAPIVFNLGM